MIEDPPVSTGMDPSSWGDVAWDNDQLKPSPRLLTEQAAVPAQNGNQPALKDGWAFNSYTDSGQVIITRGNESRLVGPAEYPDWWQDPSPQPVQLAAGDAGQVASQADPDTQPGKVDIQKMAVFPGGVPSSKPFKVVAEFVDNQGDTYYTLQYPDSTWHTVGVKADAVEITAHEKPAQPAAADPENKTGFLSLGKKFHDLRSAISNVNLPTEQLKSTAANALNFGSSNLKVLIDAQYRLLEYLASGDIARRRRLAVSYALGALMISVSVVSKALMAGGSAYLGVDREAMSGEDQSSLVKRIETYAFKEQPSDAVTIRQNLSYRAPEPKLPSSAERIILEGRARRIAHSLRLIWLRLGGVG